MSIQVETETGERLGYYDGKCVNEIEGATYRYLISGVSTADPVMVFLPAGIEDFNADVDVIDIPTPADTPSDAPAEGESEGSPPEQEQEQDSTQQFSLLILDDEKSVQIEADIAIDAPEEEETVTESLIHFSEETVEIADIEEVLKEFPQGALSFLSNNEKQCISDISTTESLCLSYQLFFLCISNPNLLKIFLINFFTKLCLML